MPPESETRKIRDSSLQENGCPSPNRHPVFSAERSSSVSSVGCWRARNVSALGRELKLMRKDLYVWRDRFLSGGPQALRGRGRPRKAEGSASAARGETAKACPPGEGPKPRTGFGSRQSGPQCDAQPARTTPVTGRPGRRPSSPLWANLRPSGAKTAVRSWTIHLSVAAGALHRAKRSRRCP